MKKFFIIIAVILGLLIIGIAVFALTFDANRYKAALITKLEESMDRDVRIDNISVNLLRGVGLEAKGLAIKEKSKTWDDFLLKADRININIEILPLLKKDIQVKRLFIPELEINAGSGAASPVFRCAVDMKVRVLINGISQDDMLKTLSAKGKVKLTNAILDNMNVLRTALDQLNMLPSLVEKLKNNLPEKYSALLDKNYTIFKPINVDFEIKDARIYFKDLFVESDAFYLTSKGSVGMIDQSLEIYSNLFIPKDLSGAFINVTPEFAYLTDKEGLIIMPLEIKGKIPSVSVMPDLNYVLRKLIASKGQELLNKLFKAR
ncbi:MAG: AsmA-like C-terminal domain-containing protein [Candidatus Omnitrophica bacterium]|nr:AsmA-like C-terminal domain-containing protein [Candidatus Omnitrophota bacterium]